jgi:hypothetical protein
MKRLALSLCLAGTMMAGGLQNRTNVRGEYIEARTADVYTGPCFANAEVDHVGNLAIFGWRVNKGEFQGVKLDGLSVVGVVRAKNTLGYIHAGVYPIKSVLIVDDKASPEQRLALKAFAERMGGDLLQEVVQVEYQPIELTFAEGNLHSRQASLTAGSLAKIQTRAINKGDQICHNEETWYAPLTKLDHAMPAYAVSHDFKGTGLNTTWSDPGKRSAFVGSFQLSE